MQPPVVIVKASAGSGKTYRLTQDYLDLLLEGDPQRYKHILAVTFTNKATEEMKSRVIAALHQLSRSDGPGAQKAADALRRMLHDYGCFSVSTIDKFFQTVMRAFAREIGQYASYRVELDDEAVLSQVVDRMLDSISDPANAMLLRWLKDYSFDLVEQGKSWSMAAPLKDMAGHFLDESFLLKMRHVSHILADKERIGAFRKKLNVLIDGFEGEARRIASEALALMGRHGWTPEDFKGKSRSPMRFFGKWEAGVFEAPKAEALRQCFDAFPDRDALSHLVEDAVSHYEDKHIIWSSARIIRDNLHLLGIYADVHRHLQAYLQENNVVLLRQSTDLLNRIIADDDTPFVYEKIGNRYDHLLLDEAQDTSVLQWNNFRPLFANSVAQGSRNLVVGDIKQSIYRWRGSDWRLMSDYLYRDLGRAAIHEETLVENWRSGAAVVGFNNTVFSRIGPILEDDPDQPGIGREISRIYGDCVQKIPGAHAGDPKGYVRMTFLSGAADDGEEEASWHDTALDRMVGDIADLRSEGYEYKDITVLVRKNSQGAEVAAHLMAHDINVLTEDSLQIGASPCIGRLMALLACQVDPDDPVNQLMISQFGVEAVASERGSLYETCERLLDDPAISPSEADLPFIHAFLDAVLAWQGKYGSSLRGFVKWWDDAGYKQAICAPDGQNAVRVMTIHKAKGLSLDAVIIPFVDETFVPRILPTLWCETSGPFTELGLIPLKAVNNLKDTCFAADLMQERIYEAVDVVNTWYVAFTRACSRLLLYAPQPGSARYKLKGIAEVLYRLFGDSLDDELRFESGERQPFVRKDKAALLVDDPQPAFSRVAMTDERLKLSLHGEDYFAAEASARQQGIVHHREMARVEVDAGLEARSGGRHWFDGTYRIFNEASIVTGSGETFRPDRVLISRDGSRVVVIDYKFGQRRGAHFTQVRGYMDLLRQMGYPSVEGWLWYLSSDESAGEVVRVG